MGGDLTYGLLHGHILVVLLLVLVVLDMVNARYRWGDVLVPLALLAACTVLLQQWLTGYSAAPLPGASLVSALPAACHNGGTIVVASRGMH